MSKMNSILKSISIAERTAKSGSKIMAVISAVTLFGMMSITVIDVFGRYFLNSPINGVWEIMGLLMVCVGSWGLALCQIEKGHINVSFFLEKLPRKIQLSLECLSYLIGIIGFSIITWQAVLLAKEYMLVEGHVTDSLFIPYFPFIIVMMLGTGMLALILITDFVRSAKEIIYP